MKLLYYESVKLLRQRAFLLLVILLLLADGVFVFLQQNSEEQDHNVSVQIEEQLAELPVAEQLSWLKEEAAFYEKAIILQQQQFIPIEAEDIPMLTEAEQARYEQADKDTLLAYQNAIRDKQAYYERIKDYPAYLLRVKDNIAAIRNGPLWKGYSVQKQQELQEQAAAYERLQTQTVAPVNYKGVEAYGTTSIGRLLSLVLMCGIGIFVYKDDDKEMKELLFATPHGQKKTAFCKIVVVVFMVFVGTFLLQMVDYFFHVMLYGSCPLTAALQSIPYFYESPYAYTVGQWLLLSAGMLAFAVSMLSIFFCMCKQIFANRLAAILGFAAFLLVEAICYYLIGETSVLSFLSYINIMRLFSGASLYLYVPLQHFGVFSISSRGLLLSCLLLLGVLSLAGYLGEYGKAISLKKFYLPSFSVSSTRLFLQEAYHLLWKRKGVWLLLFLCLYTGCTFVKNYIDTRALRENEQKVFAVYESYLGEVDQQKELALYAELEKRESIQEQLEELKDKYRQEQITLPEYREQEEQLQADMRRSRYISGLYEQWERYPSYIAYGKGYSALFAFNERTRDMQDSLWIMCVTALLLSGVYGENRLQEKLYITTINGKCKRAKTKWWQAALWGTVCFLLVEGTQLLHIYLLYPMQQLHAPLGAIHVNAAALSFPLSVDMSVWQYLLLLSGVRLFALVSLIVLCIFISRMCRNRMLSLTLLLTILLFPLLLYMGNVEAATLFSLFDLLMGNLFLQETFSFFKLGLLAVLDIGMIWMVNRSMRE